MAISFLGALSGSVVGFTVTWASSRYSAAALGGTLLAGMVPGLVLDLIGGVLADRVDARKLLVQSSLLSGVAVLLAATWLAWSPGAVVFVALNFSLSTLGALFGSSAYVLLPALFAEEELLRTNASLSLASDVAYLAGPLLGAGLFAAVGAAGALAAAAVLSLVAGSLLLALPPVPRSGAKRPLNLAFVGAGFAYLARSPTVMLIVSFLALTNLFAAAFQVATPLYAATLGGARAYAILSSAMNLGLAASNLALSTVALRPGERLFFAAGLFQGLALLGLGQSRRLPAAALFGALNDAMANTSGTVFISYLQAKLPESLLGRTFAAVNALAMGLTPLGFAAAPWFVERLGAAAVITALGAGTAAVAAVFCSLRKCWLSGR